MNGRYKKGEKAVGKPETKTMDTETEVPAAIAAMMAINPVFSKAWLDLMNEGVRFMTERLRRDFELQARLLSCRTPADLMQVQSDFMKLAMEQYAEEASRYFKMASKSAEDIKDDVEHGHKRAYNDVPV